ncbi:hypothetical protein OA93_05925 [Flavobacterium sp. KMS]|uniref:hypothetical protein n=1 Tax=Flavobacterium sp. KMS TaxID=1566023 RepID=UPI00057D59C4|nr:hypothetical protein [Flavobacterium sp. KMS]KIA99170.1 hypothetical protein OA93_05925 [Flavobacterium sp. KMS]
MKNKNKSSLLKKMWRNLDFTNINIERSELFNIIHLRSYSIVKKILIISILEFLVSLLASYIANQLEYSKEILAVEQNNIIIFLDYLYYFIFIYFFVQFFINYKRIDTSSNLNELSKSIIKTRKSVYYYIFSSLILFNLNAIIFSSIYLKNNDISLIFLNPNQSNNNILIPQICFYFILALFLIILSSFIWFIYKTLYLKLINKLNKNFEELNNTDV